MALPPLLAELLSASESPLAAALAPGRVNLIGEHTDYSGLPVLPFALAQGIAVVANAAADAQLTIRSVDSQHFPTERLPLAELHTRSRRGTWTDYVIAGLRVTPPPRGCELLVAGDLPVAAGLSSSSALVCASALLFAPAAADRLHLAEAAAAAERYVGTHSGGMDQAASLLGAAGHALLLLFRPLRVRRVTVPTDLAIVVADSGIRAEKAGLAQRAYNDRVASCRAAAALLGAPAGGLLADVPGPDRQQRALALVDPVLARRAGFVFAEAERVLAAAAALEAGDLTALGHLLQASHRGLRDEYEVSHPAVDALVDASMHHGALGARIVGAGFGGAAIALCRSTDAPALAEALRRSGAVAAFVAVPSQGAFQVPTTVLPR